jgi:hypothetical protein
MEHATNDEGPLRYVVTAADVVMQEKELVSGRKRFRFRLAVVENRDRFKAVIAGAAGPEIGDAALPLFHPIGRRNWLAALRTRISTGKEANIRFGHSAHSLRFFES